MSILWCVVFWGTKPYCRFIDSSIETSLCTFTGGIRVALPSSPARIRGGGAGAAARGGAGGGRGSGSGSAGWDAWTGEATVGGVRLKGRRDGVDGCTTYTHIPTYPHAHTHVHTPQIKSGRTTPGSTCTCGWLPRSKSCLGSSRGTAGWALSVLLVLFVDVMCTVLCVCLFVL